MCSDTSEWRKKQLGEIVEPILALKGQFTLHVHFIMTSAALNFLFGLKVRRFLVQIKHTSLISSLHACKTLAYTPKGVTSENPLWALAKSPHLTKVGGITQHVHVEQLSQVV